MKFEFSAGGVVFRNDRGKLEVLVSQHSFHHGWVFPKGLIGDREHIKDEGKKETAVREVKEETGAEGKIVHTLTPISYWYVMDGEKRKKTVYYFVMRYIGGDITQHDHEMEEVEFLPIGEVEERLTYKNDKNVFAEAKPIIERLAKV